MEFGFYLIPKTFWNSNGFTLRLPSSIALAILSGFVAVTSVIAATLLSLTRFIIVHSVARMTGFHFRHFFVHTCPTIIFCSSPVLSRRRLAIQFAAEVSNRFTALEAAHDEVTPEDLWKGTKTVLLEVARETIRSVKSQKKKEMDIWWHTVIREKREAKGKDKKRYQELKAEVQKKLRMDKQQQLEGMCAELEAANAKGNSRQVFQIVKSMTQKFQPRMQCMQCIQSAETRTQVAIFGTCDLLVMTWDLT